MAYEIVVVGTSWGGLSALRELLVSLPGTLGMPVVLVPDSWGRWLGEESTPDELKALLDNRARIMGRAVL